MANLKAYEIRFRNSPRGKVRTVTQFNADANLAAAEGMESIRQYEPEAEFVAAWEVRDPRGNAVEVGECTPEFLAFENLGQRLSGEFYARDAETGEWEQI